MRKAAVILAPGTLTLIEDAGRIGYAHLGVPRAGAFDPRSGGWPTGWSEIQKRVPLWRTWVEAWPWKPCAT